MQKERVFPTFPHLFLFESDSGEVEIITPNDEKAREKKYGLVEMLAWDITYSCNADCVHCYLGWAKEPPKQVHLPRTVLNEVLEKIRKLSPLIISITGGEPTLVEELPKIVGELSGEHKVGVITNGSRPEKIAEMLERAKDSVSISFSVDGPHGLNRKLRRVPVEVVEKSIETAKDSGAEIIINTVVMRENYRHMDKIYEEIIRKYEPDTWRLGLLMVCGNAEECQRVPPKEYFDIVRRMERVLKEDGLHTHLHTIVGDFAPRSSPCGRLWYPPTVYMLPDATLVWCNRLAQVGLAERYEPGALATTSNIRTTLPAVREECRACEYAIVCGGGCPANAFLETGSRNVPDPSICEYVKYYMRAEGEVRFHDLLLDQNAFGFNPYRFVEEVRQLDRRHVLLDELIKDPVFTAFLAFFWERIFVDSAEMLEKYTTLIRDGNAEAMELFGPEVGTYAFALNWGVDLAIGDGWGNIVGKYIVSTYGAEALTKDLPETRILKKIERLQNSFYRAFVKEKDGRELVKKIIEYLDQRGFEGNLLRKVTQFLVNSRKSGQLPVYRKFLDIVRRKYFGSASGT